MARFTFQAPTRLVFGRGLFSEAPSLIAKEAGRVLVLIGQGSVKRHGYLDRLLAGLRALGVKYAVFEGIEPNPKHYQCDEAAEAARSFGAEAVVALGGGSVMDAAKFVAVVAASGGKTWDYVKGLKPIEKALPVIAIPTLAGSGSEFSIGGVISNPDTKEKIAQGSPLLFPRLSVWDPDLTLTVPRKPTLDGIVDILSHVLDRAFGSDALPITDLWALALVERVMEVGRRLADDLGNPQLREEAALLASLAISPLHALGRQGPHWVNHLMEHVVSGHYDHVSHGSGLAALMGAWLDWVWEACERKPFPEGFKEGVKEWLRELGVPTRLRELGVPAEALPELNRALWRTFGDRLEGLMTQEETGKIFSEAW